MKPKNSLEGYLLLCLSICVLRLAGLPAWGLGSESASGSLPAQAQKQPQKKPSRPRTITGTIVRDGERFVLRAHSGQVYALDDSPRAKPFEGKAVNVTGGLDAQTRLIHIYWIDIDWV